MSDYFVIKANCWIGDAYDVTPAFFDASPLVLVALDSGRDTSKISEFLASQDIEGEEIESGYWMPRGSGHSLFQRPGLMVPFSALYAMKDGETVRPSPSFNLTTETDGIYDEAVLGPVVRDMCHFGVAAYLADGCGLLVIMGDKEVAMTLVRRLPGAEFISRLDLK